MERGRERKSACVCMAVFVCELELHAYLYIFCHSYFSTIFKASEPLQNNTQLLNIQYEPMSMQTNKQQSNGINNSSSGNGSNNGPDLSGVSQQRQTIKCFHNSSVQFLFISHTIQNPFSSFLSFFIAFIRWQPRRNRKLTWSLYCICLSFISVYFSNPDVTLRKQIKDKTQHRRRREKNNNTSP